MHINLLPSALPNKSLSTVQLICKAQAEFSGKQNPPAALVVKLTSGLTQRTNLQSGSKITDESAELLKTPDLTPEAFKHFPFIMSFINVLLITAKSVA